MEVSRRFLAISSLLLSFLLSSSLGFAGTPTKLTFSQTDMGSKFTCAHEALTKAYNNLGIDVSFLTMPSKRSLLAANNGDVDGEMLRIEGIEELYPNLLLVPVAICSVNSTVLSNKDINASSFHDLKNLIVGITRGYVDQEKLVKKFNLNAVKVNTNERLINMLLKGRVDVIFSTENEAKNWLSNKKMNIFQQVGLNRSIYLYHYLHKKNEKLLPLIANELRALNKNNALDLTNRIY